MDILADGASIASASMVSGTVAAAAAPEKKNKKNKTTRGKKKRSPKLPVQLMQLLNEGSHPKALWWLPGEKDFAINADVFPSEVLEVYFPGTKYASFIRQLHKLGFARETRALKKVHSALARHTVAFSHECFRRDQPELMEQIRNINTKAGKAKKLMGKNNSKSALVAPVSPLESPVVPPAIIETASPAIPYVPAMSAPEAIPSIPPVQKPDAGSFHPMHMQQQQHDPSVNDDAALLLSLQILRQQREAEEQERQLQLILMQQRRQQEELELQQLLVQQQQEMELQHLLRQQQQQQQAYANPYHHPDAFVSSTTTAQDPLMRYLSAALDTSAAPSPYQDQLLSYQQALAQQQQQQFNPFSPNANYSLGNFF